MRAPSITALLFVCAAAFGFSRPVSAQSQNAPSAEPNATDERLEGLTIDIIELEAPPREAKDELLALSGLRVGEAFRAAQIRRAVKILYQLGRFENVYVFGRRVGNIVQLRLKITPRPHVREVTVISSGVMSDEDVQTAIGLQIGSELDPLTFAERRNALRLALERLGHRSPAIGIGMRNTDADGGSELLVRIDEGPVTRLGKLIVLGQPRFAAWRIREDLGVYKGDVLDLDEVRIGVERLIRDYRKRGYLGVHVDPPRVVAPRGEVNPVADLELHIVAGPKVTIRFLGNRSVPIRELEAAVEELNKTEVRPAVLTELKERLHELYERRGFWQAQVEAGLRTSPDGERQDIIFSIREGKRALVVDVSFEGNQDLDADLLRAKVRQVVAQSLGTDAVAAPADAIEIDHIVGNGSLWGPEDEQRPSPADPDPDRVYIKRAYDTAADALEDLYRAEGFQRVEVGRPEVVVVDKGRGLRVNFPVKQGIRWRIGTVAFAGNAALEANELLTISGLEPGRPLSFYEVDEAGRGIRREYRNRGFLFARVDEEFRPVQRRGALPLSRSRTATVASKNMSQVCAAAEAGGKADCHVELVYNVHEGPLVKARNVVVRGNTHTRDALVNSEITIAERELLSAADMTRTQRNLTRLGVFRRVAVRPMDEETEASEKDVLVELQERKHSSFELGAGVSTEQGVKAFATYAHSNLLGSALRFRANAKVNVQTFRFLFNDAIASFIGEEPVEFLAAVGVQYPRIVGLPRGFGVGLDIIVARDNDPAFRDNTRKVAITGNYKGFAPRILGAERPLALQLRTSFDRSNIVCNDIERAGQFRTICRLIDAPAGGRPTLNADYVGVLVGASWDFRDNRINPRKGVYTELLPELFAGLNQQSPTHLNVKFRLNGYVPLGESSTWATSLLFWRIVRLGNSAAEIPPNRRLFAGGRSTIRGFQEQTLFPHAIVPQAPAGEDEVSPGGVMFAGIKSELRFPVAGALAGTLFADFGDLFDENSGTFSLLELGRLSVGAGLRYATPIGPLLFDVAVALPTGQTTQADWAPHFAAVGSF